MKAKDQLEFFQSILDTNPSIVIERIIVILQEYIRLVTELEKLTNSKTKKSGKKIFFDLITVSEIDKIKNGASK